MRHEQLQPADHHQRDQAGHQQPQRQIDDAEMQAWPDIGRLDQPIVHAEHQHERDLGDEQQAEEEREAAQRFVAAPLEGDVVHLIDRRAEQIERRQRDHRRQDRIDAERRVGDVGDVGAQNDEGGMGDVDDVQHAERDRHADRDGGIEAAEQQAGHHGVAEEIEGHFHYADQSGQCAESWLAPTPCHCERSGISIGAHCDGDCRVTCQHLERFDSVKASRHLRPSPRIAVWRVRSSFAAMPELIGSAQARRAASSGMTLVGVPPTTLAICAASSSCR